MERDVTGDVLKVVMKTAVGAVIGIAGGMTLVTIAAAAGAGEQSYHVLYSLKYWESPAEQQEWRMV